MNAVELCVSVIFNIFLSSSVVSGHVSTVWFMESWSMNDTNVW